MHGRRNNNEKPQNFSSSIKRLIKELKDFRIIIVIALMLAAIGSIISIFTPNILSNLTDKIAEGLVINTKNIEEITNNITNNLNQEKLTKELPKVLDLKIDNNIINEITSSSDISDDQKSKFLSLLQNEDKSNMINELSELDDSTLNILLKESTYNNITISVEDKITLIKNLNNKDNINIPTSIMEALLEEIEVDNVKISSHDQAIFVNKLTEFKNSNSTDVKTQYSKIDELPDSIKKLLMPKMDMNGIKNIALLLLILYLISALFNYIESISMTDVSNKFAKKLRTDISHKINKLPLKFFDKNKKGDILSRVTNDVDTIAQTMNNSLATLVSALTLFLGTIIMMFVTNAIMAITAILSSFIGFIFMLMVLSKSQKYFTARQKELGNMNAHIEEIYSGLNVVKAYNGKESSDKKFDELNEKLYDANRKSQFLSGLMMPMMGFIGNFGYVAVCIVGALLTMNGNITFGVIIAFITYVRLFTSPLSQIAQSMTSLQSTAAAGERVFEFKDAEEMSNQKEINKSLNKDKVKGKIEFENVSFTYDGNEEPTITNFSAIAKPGQKVAIVGPTGAGKTTMVNLLMKFYDISGGDIKIDNISIKSLTRENIHELFTMVLQDTWVFDGTIKENIIYNRKNITDEKVSEVCKIVGLDHFIRSLSNGYDSKLSDNDTISAGQKQLLTIARAMLEESPFLILDEATSNVDTRTEELVQKAMDKLTEGKTSFIIAHRLSTIKNADLILVMKEGNIIEQGNHDELMKKDGFYAKLYNSQFEL